MYRESLAAGPWFLELADAGQTLPPNTLVDGEMILVDQRGGAWDVSALQRRLGLARRDAHQVANVCPAVLLCFDLLIVEARI